MASEPGVPGPGWAPGGGPWEPPPPAGEVPEPPAAADAVGGGPSASGGPGSRRAAPGRALALVVAAALVGSAASLGVARATGWGQRTVVQQYVTGGAVASAPAGIPDILARVLPSVVSITATTEAPSPFFGAGSSTTVASAEGTGVIVTAGGQVVTNDHVVAGATSIAVTLDGSTTRLQATLVGSLPGNDLALLQIRGASGLQPASFGSSADAAVGDGVVAVGYALGLAGGPTVTAGIISAEGREVSTQSAAGGTVVLHDMLQTDAAISSGNSGGPLVDAAARVVGIDTAVATSTSSVTAQNIGFAIPAATVLRLLPVLRQGGG